MVDVRDNPESRSIASLRLNRLFIFADLRADQSYLGKNRSVVALVEVVGARTFVSVPMLKEGELIGAINIYRQEVRPFTDKQIELVQNFAAQAVIAIENTRLLNELRESLQQQTATADVLKVISSSPGELEPVFQTMLENATRICEAKFGILMLVDGDGFTSVAINGAPPAYAEAVTQNRVHSTKTGSVASRSSLRPSYRYKSPTSQSEPAYIGNRLTTLGGARTLLDSSNAERQRIGRCD